MEEINQKIYDKAVALLAIRMHTTGELYRKLKTRGFRDAEIRPALQRLEELKFLDDERFAEIFVENLKRYKDFGYYGIKAKLLQRQIPANLAERALAGFFTVADEQAVATRLLKKKSAAGGKDAARWEKMARALQSRGFRPDVARKVLSDFA